MSYDQIDDISHILDLTDYAGDYILDYDMDTPVHLRNAPWPEWSRAQIAEYAPPDRVWNRDRQCWEEG